MKIKVSELEGVALDYAVALCEGGTGFWYDTVATYWIKINGKDRALSKGWAQSFQPSLDWSQGGPIIEREYISTYRATGCWKAHKFSIKQDDYTFKVGGESLLQAAMRCYVASKLGDSVDIPDVLNRTEHSPCRFPLNVLFR